MKLKVFNILGRDTLHIVETLISEEHEVPFLGIKRVGLTLPDTPPV